MKVFAFIKDRPTYIRRDPHSGWIVTPASAAGAKLLPFNFEITDDGAGRFLLVYYSADKKYGADTWHPTLDEAYLVAEKQFGIRQYEWAIAGQDNFPPLSTSR